MGLVRDKMGRRSATLAPTTVARRLLLLVSIFILVAVLYLATAVLRGQSLRADSLLVDGIVVVSSKGNSEDTSLRVGLGEGNGDDAKSFANAPDVGGDPACGHWVGEGLLAEWAKGRRAVCTPVMAGLIPLADGVPLPSELSAGLKGNSSATSSTFYVKTQPLVEEWRLSKFKHSPQMRDYRDVVLVGGLQGDPEPLVCTEDSPHFHHENGKFPRSWLLPPNGRVPRPSPPVNGVVYDRVYVRVRRFDIGNPYEAFHAYVNAHAVFRQFNLRRAEVQFVLTDDLHAHPNDDSFWRALSGNNFPPLYNVSQQQAESAGGDSAHRPNRILAKRVIDAPSAGGSIITAWVMGTPLSGRGTSHHCKSSVMRDAVNWIRASFGVEPPAVYRSAPVTSPNPIKVIYSSRRDFVNALGVSIATKRKLDNETGFIAELGRSLGKGYAVEAVDFAALTPKECIAKASAAHVMIGVHGAGLMWSAYLPRHGMLVEMFGGDRSPANRHYHNIASLVDIHYGEHLLDGVNDAMPWNHILVQAIGSKITKAGVLTSGEPL